MQQERLQEIKRRYNVVGNCDALNHALDVCLQVASTDLSVLIVGESGVGKEILPRIIHDNSPRRRENYFAINCGSIPEGTIDSELFGHEKGSFTGAVGESEGYFGIADKGTLFLDEVGELPLATQARLLRVLETGEYIRVGGQAIRKTNVRIVAATNVNMKKAISEGRFREDLFYRLNTIPVSLPPLRERGKDILLLFRLFAYQMMEKYRLPRLELTEGACRLLLKYKWPGNIRQLKNITEQLSVLSTEKVITEEMLLKFIPDDEESMALVSNGKSSSDSYSYDSERQILFNILFELRSKVSSLDNEVAELKREIIALGGNVSRSKGVRALPAPIRELPNNMQEFVDTTATGTPSTTTSPATVPSSPTVSTLQTTVDLSNIEEIEAEEIREDIVPGNSSEKKESKSGMETATAADDDLTFSRSKMRKMEIQYIQEALARNNGNRRKTALELGIPERTLYRRLEQLNAARKENSK